MGQKGGLIDIVFLPGLACVPERLYSQQISRFRELGHNIITVDNTRATTSRELVTQIIDRVQKPAHFIGLSAGGYALLELLQTEPGLVEKAVFMSTQAQPDSPEKKAARMESVERARNGEYENVIEDLSKMMYSTPDATVSSIYTYKQMAKDVGVSGYENQMAQILTKPDFLPSLNKINKKCLVIDSWNDKLFPDGMGREIADGINQGEGSAKYVTIKDCGHLSTIEQPHLTTDLLAGFLSRNIERKQIRSL